MSKPKRVEIEAVTFPAAGRILGVSATMIRRFVSSGKLTEAFLCGPEPKSGHYRLVTVESVERLRREREVRDA